MKQKSSALVIWTFFTSPWLVTGPDKQTYSWRNIQFSGKQIWMILYSDIIMKIMMRINTKHVFLYNLSDLLVMQNK